MTNPVIPVQRPAPRPARDRHGRPIAESDPAAWLGNMTAAEALARGLDAGAVYNSLLRRETDRVLRIARERHAREIARLEALIAAAAAREDEDAPTGAARFSVELVMISPDGIPVPFRISGENLDDVRREYDTAIPALVSNGWRQSK